MRGRRRVLGGSVVVSFEGNTIKVLYGTLKGRDIVVSDALSLRDDQFDDFLRKEKTKEFIVVNSFKDFYQDTILIPSTKNKFVKKLVDIETRKKSPFKDLSFIYTISGEKIIENRRMKEVSVFAVNNDEINGIVSRFISRGKVVRAIYHDIFSIASQIETGDLPVLCVSEVGLNKNLFLIRDGRIHFARTAQSIEPGLNDFDIQNINMTINYCRQTFRTNPFSIMLIGSLCNNFNATMATLVPMSCFTQKLYRIKQVVSLDFISPITAIHARKRDINLLPAQLRSFFQIRMFLRYSTFLMLFLSVIGVIYGVYIAKRSVDLRDNIVSKRISPADLNATLYLHDSKKAELSRYAPFIKLVRDALSSPEPYRFLALLSDLKTDNIKINSVSVNAGDDVLKIGLKGLVKTDGYAVMQEDYQRFIDQTAALKGVIIKKNEIELKDKSFQIEMQWRAGS